METLNEFTVEAFQCQLQAESMPPDSDWVESRLYQHLPSEARVLQWAIVKSHPEKGELWVEGCAVVPKTK
jgi:hypothetical protein